MSPCNAVDEWVFCFCFFFRRKSWIFSRLKHPKKYETYEVRIYLAKNKPKTKTFGSGSARAHRTRLPNFRLSSPKNRSGHWTPNNFGRILRGMLGPACTTAYVTTFFYAVFCDKNGCIWCSYVCVCVTRCIRSYYCSLV